MRGKFDALKLLEDDCEIMGWVDDSAVAAKGAKVPMRAESADLCRIAACIMVATSLMAVFAKDATAELYNARFRPDSADNTYAVGAKAFVEASITDKHGKVVTDGKVEMWADDGWTNVLWRTTLDLSRTPTVKVELTRNTPGSIRFHAKGLRFAKYHDIDRIIFGVDGIRPLTPFPDDFATYWRGEQARLEREVPFEVDKTPAPRLSTPDRDAYYVSFPTFRGKRVYGVLAVPKGGGRYPAIVNVPGAGPGRCDFHGEIVRKGWITLMMNVHEFPVGANGREQKARFAKHLKRLQEESGEPRYQRYGFGTGRRDAPIYHDMALGMVRAIEWLSREPYADPSRFVYYGLSQGGGFGMELTALWGKFAKSAIFCPNMCDMLSYRFGREPGSEHIKSQTDAHRPLAEMVGPYYDSCNFARMIMTPVRMSYGMRDGNCNTVGGIAAFNAIASPDKSLVLIPGKGHSVRGKDVPSILRWLFDML